MASSPAEGGPLDLHINAVGAVMGGAARHLDPFLRELRRARPGWRITLWATEGSRALADLPVEVELRNVPPLGRLARVRWESVTLPRELRRVRASALLNLTNSGPVRCGVPSVLYQRNALYFDPNWLRTRGPGGQIDAWIRRSLAFAQLRGACVGIVPSAAMAGFLTRWRAFPRSRELRVIPHGVDTDRFDFTPRAWPPDRDRPLRLVSVGHAGPYKDQEVLVRTLAELRTRGRDVSLAVTMTRDDAPDIFDAFIASARRHDVLQDIDVLGQVDDVERLYREADIMVLPSISESFGFPVVEAMACGIPVVGSRIGATVDLLGPGGWYFSTGDAREAADAIDAATATPPEDMQRILREENAVARSLSWERNVRGVVAAIESCSARSRKS